jgi:hypothetical protein
MAITRSFSNANEVTEYTQEINALDRQFTALIPENLITKFDAPYKTVTFQKDTRTTTLLESVNRGGKGTTWNQDRVWDEFEIRLAYFKHSDRLTPEDIDSVRAWGLPDGVERIDAARVRKLENMRRAFEQTMEYMKWKMATTGQCVTPSGQLVVDMFAEFGITQTEVTWDLTSSSFDLSAALRDLQNKTADNLAMGGEAMPFEVNLSTADFDALIAHANVKDTYKYFSATVNPQRDNIVDGFRHAGVFIRPRYGAFNLPTGVTEKLLEDGAGYSIPMAPIYRQYAGTAFKLSQVNGGQIAEMYVNQYADPRDEYLELVLESSPLFVSERPAATIKINVVTA